MKQTLSRPSELTPPRPWILALAWGLALSLSIAPNIMSETVDDCVTLRDSLRLCYSYQTNDSAKARALVVTLPMLSRDRSSYDAIVARLSREFPQLSFINFDLRGHGLSTVVGGDSVSFKSMDRTDFPKIPHDVREALRLLRKQRSELRKLPLVVIGASIGANSAAILANVETRVKAAILLSPGLDYRGLIPGPHLSMTDGKRILLMVGKSDTYSYTSTDSLYRLTEGVKTLEVFNTANHGTNIPNNDDGALDDIVQWMRVTLETLKK